jgi:hypothetical protein
MTHVVYWLYDETCHDQQIDGYGVSRREVHTRDERTGRFTG